MTRLVLLLAAVLLPAVAAAQAPVLVDNGPFVTGLGNGAGGANTSVVQASLGLTTFGVSHNAAQGNFVADEFTVPTGGWTVEAAEFVEFRAGGSPTAPAVATYVLQIWNGRPGDAGSTIVFGDLTTNRLTGSAFTGAYRVGETALTNGTRPIWRHTVSVGASLPAGTYWLQWGTTPNTPTTLTTLPVTVLGAVPPGNARVLSGGTWRALLDGATPLDLPFVLRGTSGAAPAPLLGTNPGSLAFGTVRVGTASAPQTVTLTNLGAGTLEISQVAASGPGFAVSTAGTATQLAAGASTTVSVTFTPKAGGPAQGSLTVVSSDPGSPRLLPLGGTGDASVATTLPPGTTAGGPTFARPLGAGDGTSGSCIPDPFVTAVPYAAIEMDVAEGGTYAVETRYTSFDGFLLLYRGPFVPEDPCLNLLALNDDFETAAASRVAAVALAAGRYVVVVSGYRDDSAGPFTGVVEGPTAVTFVPVAGEGGPGAVAGTLAVVPNPVRGAAEVVLALAQPQDVEVAVFDVVGRRVATLSGGPAGAALRLRLDTAAWPAGVYVVRALGAEVDLARHLTVVR